jgi:DNA polymerase III sliding clamp (beta) subunit (PCNA family)
MIRIKNTDHFKKSIDLISNFIDECNIHINEDGLYVKAFDSANVLFIHYHISPEGLEGELSSEVLGVNLTELNKVVSKLSSTDKLKLEIDKSVKIIIQGQYNRSYSFPIKDLDENELSINLDEYKTEVKINAGIIKDIFSSAKTIAEAVVLKIKDSKIEFFADGIYGKYNTEIDANTDEEYQTKFHASYLHNMVRNIDPEVKINMKLNKEHPLYVTYNLGAHKLQFYLAHMFI